MRKRRTARVLLFDEAGRLLLIRFVVPRQDGAFCFWAAPGGEIEAGETPAAAAARELREELGIEAEIAGPVWEEANQFLHQEEMQDNRDYFFRARCGAEAPVLAGVTEDEIAIMKEIRWWTAAEIAGTTERVFPIDLAVRMRDLEVGPRRAAGDST